MEVWKIFKLLKIWKTYNEVGGVIMPYVLFVESGDCSAHFGCGTSRNLCTHFVVLLHFCSLAHLETYMYFSFCGKTLCLLNIF
uniref:Uncharacterized protein n=1 Tax=Triticum urartu TaxID=4572 RepID=A0A8R7QBL5_TRIUA